MKKQGISAQFLSNMLILSKLLSKLMREIQNKLLLSPEVIFVVLVYTATYILPSPATFQVVHKNLQNNTSSLLKSRSLHLKIGKNKIRHQEDEEEFQSFRKQLQNVLKNQSDTDEANCKKKQFKSTVCIMKKNNSIRSFSCHSDQFAKNNHRPQSSGIQNKSRPLRIFSEHNGQAKGWRKESLLKHDYVPFFKGKNENKEIKKNSNNEIKKIQVIKRNRIITQKFVFRRKQSVLRL